MTAWLTETLTVHREVPVLDPEGKPTRDQYGTPITTVVPHTLAGCAWEPRPASYGSENVDSRDQVTSGLILYVDDPDADLLPTDTVSVEGEEWQVVGRVGRFRGTLGHVSAALEKVTG